MRHVILFSCVLWYLPTTSVWAQTSSASRPTPVESDDLLRERGDDFDGEDVAALPVLPRKSEVQLPSKFQLSLVGWYEPLSALRSDIGAAAILTIAWGGGTRRLKIPAAPLPTLHPDVLPVGAFSDVPATNSCGGREASRLSSAELRVVVQAALRVAGLATTAARLDDLASRARLAGILPEMRLRGVRSNDQTLRLSPVDGEPYRTLASGGASMLWEARMTWRLDRLAYADDELSVERQRAELYQQRYRITHNVVEQVSLWQKARARACDARATDEEKSDALAREAAADTMLDGLTDGAWSKSRKHQ